MPGVYGEQLAAFPELMEWHDVFTMETLASGTFGPRKPYRKVRGYLTSNIGGDAAAPDGNFAGFERSQFFCFNPIPVAIISQGCYVEYEGNIFKFTHDDEYRKEGGFVVHRLLMVSGPTDQQVPNPQVEENVLNGF